jgi:hypothetical protein
MLPEAVQFLNRLVAVSPLSAARNQSVESVKSQSKSALGPF